MPTTTQTKACGACTYWKDTGNGEGECHRHAPQAIAFNVDDQLKVESRFPSTTKDDWCGDFEPA